MEDSPAGLQRLDADHLGRHIFLNVATAANTGALELWAIDRSKQKVSWKRPMAADNHMERKQNMSSPSPVTDGRRVGHDRRRVLKAFDFAGKELWSRKSRPTTAGSA